ncbi:MULTISPECIES: hypothetical protein [unclassified Mameliella]|nr:MULTISPECIES: hypothetical protein [unclassified Mameliella]
MIDRASSYSAKARRAPLSMMAQAAQVSAAARVDQEMVCRELHAFPFVA